MLDLWLSSPASFAVRTCRSRDDDHGKIQITNLKRGQGKAKPADRGVCGLYPCVEESGEEVVCEVRENYRSRHKPNGTDPRVCGSCRVIRRGSFLWPGTAGWWQHILTSSSSCLQLFSLTVPFFVQLFRAVRHRYPFPSQYCYRSVHPALLHPAPQ